MRTLIKPANQTLYRQRCKAAKACFEHVDLMPAFVVTYTCYSVMHRALGGNLAILRYVIGQVFSQAWSNYSREMWWTWHLYIRCRSRGEIQELIDQDLEELTGEDHREWPDVITTENSYLGFTEDGEQYKVPKDLL